jgi:DNA-binding NarL/FixJ family response regulator
MRLCILLTRDSEFQNDLTSMLVSGGYRVRVSRTIGAAKRCLQDRKQSLLLFDLGAPTSPDSLKALPSISARFPQTRVLAWVDRGDRQQALQALQLGADGCLEKSSPKNRILRAMSEICDGGHPLSDSLFRGLVGRLKQSSETVMTRFPANSFLDSTAEPLSSREAEIYSLLCLGYSNKGIAEKICLGLDAVRYHLKHLYRKLKVHSRTEAVALCFANGATPVSQSGSPSSRRTPQKSRQKNLLIS